MSCGLRNHVDIQLQKELPTTMAEKRLELAIRERTLANHI